MMSKPAFIESSIPYLSEKIFNKFQNNVLLFVNNELLNQKFKN